MPCFFPLQASFKLSNSGRKCQVRFVQTNLERFVAGKDVKLYSDTDGNFSVPCGRCIGCRLERSRQWAVRCMHEASMYEDNCFVTLTFDDQYLSKMCPTGSLCRRHMQDFMKALRQKFKPLKIRAFYCGEYGEMNFRPHYHILLFNLDFEDKMYWKSVNGHKYYISKDLSKLWPYGWSTVGDVTFESAAYVARYCTKKITGVKAEEHYQGRLPEFAQASLKPGIGSAWLEKFGMSDVYSLDEVVTRGVKTKPPRYYDKWLEKKDEDLLLDFKKQRRERAALKEDDSTFRRLQDKFKCQTARMKLLVRALEAQSV